jgi:anti-sigma28 factor (negative regulator of flagellin synthesis)
MFGQNDEQPVSARQADPCQDRDAVMEQILESIDTTPIGRVLKQIASLPEVRREKILRLRRQITEGRYDVKERLDLALDKVIEDLTA